MDFLVGASSMLVLDSFYLSLVKSQWSKMIKNIQGTNLEIRLTSAIGVYILMSFALYYFIIKPKKSVYDAALLGLVIYGVFDLTNYALFRDYNLAIGLIDMLWGGLLFASTTYLVKKIFHK